MLLMSTSIVTAAVCNHVADDADLVDWEFSMTDTSASPGVISCAAYGSKNITVDAGTGEIDYHEGSAGYDFHGDKPSDTGSEITTGIVIAGGTFTIAGSVWSGVDALYIALKQGTNWGLFRFTQMVLGGTYSTEPGDGTDISHAFSIGGECTAQDKDCEGITDPEGNPVPVPAAVWLFGSALFGLMGVSRKKKSKMA